MAIDYNKIPTALPSKSKLDLSCDHVTTMDFGDLQCVHYRHVIKGERIDLAGVATVRPFPLACPTFGRLRCNIHHFFVPWRIVFPQYESFYNDTVAVNFQHASLVDSAPYFLNSTVAEMFLGLAPTLPIILATVISNYQDGDPYDFYFDSKYYRFSTLGKRFYKFLTSLGYEINFDTKDRVQMSALPLLAWSKVYLDYYANQSYMDTDDVITIKKALSYNDPSSPLEISATWFVVFLAFVQKVQYEQDYYIGAWDNPFAPNSGNFSAVTFQDVVSGVAVRAGVAADTFGTPYMVQASAANPRIGSEYAHSMLKALTDYSKRHQLAGASNINRVLAQYGFGVEALKLDRAIHIQGSSIDINTGAVFSTANTASSSSPSTLGDYAGNGFGQGNSDFSFTAEEFGILLTFATIHPSGGYFQGCDENNMHVRRFDFYTPEFDSCGTQILRRREVYVSKNANLFAPNSENYDLAFGHISRYAEYKRPKSWVTGDFRCDTRFRGSSSWHLMRMFTDKSFRESVDNVVHSPNFTKMVDSDQYRRIFTFTDGDNDPFYAEFHWSVGVHAPCHPLFEGYQFETESNKKVSLESQGSIVN